MSIETDCPKCAVMRDLLETAYREVDKARAESDKADDEAMELKAKMLHLKAVGAKQDYALIKQFERRALVAEQALTARQKETPDE